MDFKELPEKYDENIVIITRKYSFKFILLNIFIDLKNKFLGIEKENYINSFSSNYKKYKVIKNILCKIIYKNKIRIIFTSYEAHTYQIGIFNYIKNKFKDIITVGYIHSALPPLPTEYINRQGSPDLLITHGIYQKKILVDLLKWKKDRIINISSMRYQDNNKLESNVVYLPYCIENKHIILNEFKKLLIEKAEIINIKNLKFRNHPAMKNSNPHNGLIKDLKKIRDQINHSKKKYLKFESYPIVIGATAVIIELLELGYTVFHLSSLPLFDVYSPLIWEGIEVKHMSKNIFVYKLKSKNIYIQKDSKKVNLNVVLKRII